MVKANDKRFGVCFFIYNFDYAILKTPLSSVVLLLPDNWLDYFDNFSNCFMKKLIAIFITWLFKENYNGEF